MRIGIDARELVAGRCTGIGRILRNLLPEFGRADLGNSLVLYGNQRTRFADEAASIPHRTMHERLTLCWDQASLPRALRVDRIQIFWSPYYKVPLRPPCPVVNTIHDLIPMTFGPPMSRALFGLACRIYARRAAATLTDSEVSRAGIVRQLGIPEAKIHVVPLAVSPHFRPPDEVRRHAVLSRYGLASGYLLTVTNFQPHKNLDGLLEAFRQLPAMMQRDHTLVLVGDGPGRPPLETLRDVSGLHGRVVALGNVPDEDLTNLYAGAAAFVLPSLDEGFGLPALEAMACGTPVVCAEAGALPEVVGDAALLVDPRDPAAIAAGIQKVLANRDLTETLRARGLEHAGRYTPERMAGAIRDVLYSILTGGLS